MHKRFLELYNRELMHLRKMGAQFAENFPKIAGRLGGLDGANDCPDPFVERLLEGFAFLSARVQHKLEAEFPRFTQSILETVYPHYLKPLPSMAIVRFEPDYDEADLATGFTIPRGSSLFSRLGKNDKTRCEFRTAHDVNLWPVRIESAEYLTRELASLGVAESGGIKAGLRICLKCTAGLKFSELSVDSLPFHLTGVGEIPMYLYEQFFADTVSVVVQSVGSRKKQSILDSTCISRLGFDNNQRLLPYDVRSFQGYRLLHEYFSFPQRFMFTEINGINRALRQFDEDRLDIIILFRKAVNELKSVVRADNFSLFCTPAINLFEKRADRIHISDRFSEFHVLCDRTKPLDYEVYTVTKVEGFGAQSEQLNEFLPIYCARGSGKSTDRAYYVTHRIPRTKTDRTSFKNQRSSDYFGSEVYLSLVDDSAPPFSENLKQLGVEVLCTNRDLPLSMPMTKSGCEFTMDVTIPCDSIHSVGEITSPKPSYIEGDIAWRAVNHLSLNYLSLTDTKNGTAVSAFRDILRLYSQAHGLQTEKQIEGIRDLKCRPITQRIIGAGSLAFARGLEMTVTMDEKEFAGSGVFLFGAVLEQFFARYVSINSFTETVIKTIERGEIMRWPMTTGRRHIA